MNQNIDLYLTVSGASSTEKSQFKNFVSSFSELASSDSLITADKIKAELKRKGFTYNNDAFTAQDVLKANGGNCLGQPFLYACILEKLGLKSSFVIATTPYDKTYEQEGKKLDRINQETDYSDPQLAEEQEEFPEYRFAPLEHLVLDLNGKLFESTSEESDFPEAESLIPINFEQALSCIYKDRAIEVLSDGDRETAQKLAEKGLKYWDENKQLYAFLAALAYDDFDDTNFNKQLERFHNLKIEDSISLLTLSTLKQDQESFDAAVKKYPNLAIGIAEKASKEKDPAEAGYLFAVASQSYANSMTLNLGDFYINYSQELANLFGKEKIVARLENFAEQKWGEFAYHLALFNLTKDKNQLAEAEEARETPLQKLLFLAIAKNPELINELDAQFRNSEIYQKIRKSLKIG